MTAEMDAWLRDEVGASEPFVWQRFTGSFGSDAWDNIEIANSDVAMQRGCSVTVPVSRLAEFEALVRKIREEVEG